MLRIERIIVIYNMSTIVSNIYLFVLEIKYQLSKDMKLTIQMSNVLLLTRQKKENHSIFKE